VNEIQWATPEIWIYREDYQTQVCIDSPPNDAVKYVKASTALTLSSRVVDLEDIVKNLSMLVKRLSRFAPDDIAEKAKDYLSRQGFTGSPLRENVGGLNCGVDLITGKGVCVCGRCLPSNRGR
jgi:hypothetical protein